jgi:hypothetical protein
MIVEFELVKKDKDKTMRRLVQDVYIDGYQKFPDEVEKLLQEGFVIADNRLVEEPDSVQDLKLYFAMFAILKEHEYHASAGYVFAYSEDRAIEMLQKRYGEETRVRSIEELKFEEGTVLYGERWHKL